MARGLALFIAAALFAQLAFADKNDIHSADYRSPTPCELCERPDVQGPKAGPWVLPGLYNEDFEIFCNKCPNFKRIRKDVGPSKLAEMNKKVQSTNKSPTPCQLCMRPDVVGPDASALYNDDFKIFCSKCPKQFDDGKPGTNDFPGGSDAMGGPTSNLIELPANAEVPSLTNELSAAGYQRAPLAASVLFAGLFFGVVAQVARGVYTKQDEPVLPEA